MAQSQDRKRLPLICTIYFPDGMDTNSLRHTRDSLRRHLGVTGVSQDHFYLDSDVRERRIGVHADVSPLIVKAIERNLDTDQLAQDIESKYH